MIVFVVFLIPATMLLAKYGLRKAMIAATVTNCIGAWIKCVAVELATPAGVTTVAGSSAFGVLMFGQTICALTNALVLNVPAQLSASWFAAKEVAMATSIGVFGNQVNCPHSSRPKLV